MEWFGGAFENAADDKVDDDDNQQKRCANNKGKYAFKTVLKKRKLVCIGKIVVCDNTDKDHCNECRQWNLPMYFILFAAFQIHAGPEKPGARKYKEEDDKCNGAH